MDGHKGIFGQCCIAFVPSAELPPKRIYELATDVKANGGTVSEPHEDGTIVLQEATHVIANNINFKQYTETHARMVPVVSERWISSSMAKGKAMPLRAYSPDPRLIFSSVVTTCIGLPDIDRESIIGATMALGGSEARQVSRQTTHICALTGSEAECVEAKAKGSKAKIVLPHWFDDCFKLGKRIDEGPYLLPNAEILKSFQDSAVHIPPSSNLEGATCAMPNYLPVEHRNSERAPLSVFRSKKIMLASDLTLRDNLLKILTDFISESGGELVGNVDECDIFICHYRSGEEYVKAASAAKDVGNLSWLFHLITTNEWSSPLHRLLHYPVPKDGIPGFAGLRITVSNYGGDARTYLENLVVAAGAEFTKVMRQDNTHLITARNSSEKCEAAGDWGITMVNHLWLEESYAKCAMQPCSGLKFNHFPARTNLGEVIGQTFFDEARLREIYYPVPDEELTPDARRRRLILEAAQENAFTNGPAAGLTIGREDIKVWREKAKKEAQTIADSVKRPHVAAGKENVMPPRSAKKLATKTLQLLADDIQQYQRESKRKSKDGKGPWGGKRAADELDEVAQQPSKKTKTTKSKEQTLEEGREVTKQKPMLEKPYNMTILVTGYPRWIYPAGKTQERKKEARDKMKLGELGIKIVQETSGCPQYLAAPKIMRTLKFIAGLTRGATVISTDFLDAVLTTGTLANPKEFLLKDAEYENERAYKLSRATSRARANAGKLLSGVPIYCSEHVKHGRETYQFIATINGAIFKTYDGKHRTIKKTSPEEDGGAPPDPVYLLSSHTKADQELYPKFRQMAIEGHCEPRIVTSEWLLDVVMNQEVTYDPHFAVDNWHTQGNSSRAAR